MFSVTRLITFCYGHRLLNYDGKCKYVHGHNGRVELTLAADVLDHRGMVVDFSDIKKVMKEWIDDNLDHAMLMHQDDPMLKAFQEYQQPVFTMESNPTAENIAKLIFDHANKQDFPIHSVNFWETESCFASYQGGICVDQSGAKPIS